MMDPDKGSIRTLSPTLVMAFLLISGSAHAQPVPSEPTPYKAGQVEATAPASQPSGEPKPWAKGVSKQDQDEALVLFRQGNKLFADEKHSEAAKKYEQALEHWDHPSIRYNMVECLVNAGRNLEAFNHLEAAMRYGAAPLGPKLFRQAKTYLNILKQGLARVRVICKVPGARVTLDGKPLFTGPGEATRRLQPGLHALVATRRGYITTARQANLPAGKLTAVTLTLVPRKPEVVMERRWERRWVPWAVLGAGAGLALVALPLYLLAAGDYADYQDQFKTLCSDRPAGGCDPATLTGADKQTWSDMVDLEGQADAKYYSSIGLLATGSALAAAGVVLVILNQPRAVKRGPAPSPASLPVKVSLTPRGGRLSLTWSF